MDILFQRRQLINHAVQPALTRMGVDNDPGEVWKILPKELIDLLPPGRWVKREFSVNVGPKTEASHFNAVAIHEYVHQNMLRKEFEQLIQHAVKYARHVTRRQCMKFEERERFIELTQQFTDTEFLPHHEWSFDSGERSERSVATFQTRAGPRVLTLSGADNRVLTLSSTIRSHYAAYAKWAGTCCIDEVIYG